MKNCLFCKHYYFEPYERGYSDYTPGGPASIGCARRNWSMNKFVSEREYRDAMASAAQCRDFEERALP